MAIGTLLPRNLIGQTYVPAAALAPVKMLAPSLLPPPPKPAIAVLGKVATPVSIATRAIAAPSTAYGFKPPAGLQGPEGRIAAKQAAQAKAQTATPAEVALPLVVDAAPMFAQEPSGGASPGYFEADAPTSAAPYRPALTAAAYGGAAASLPSSTNWTLIAGGGILAAGLAWWAYKKGFFK